MRNRAITKLHGLRITVAALLLAGVSYGFAKTPPTDPKGDLFVIVPAGAAPSTVESLTRGLSRQFAQGDTALDVLVLKRTAPRAVAEQLAALPPGQQARLAAVIEVAFDKAANTEATQVGIYHYPFADIARERIASPVYTFKFASDSALLGIHLYEALSAAANDEASPLADAMLRPMSTVNHHLPRDTARRCVRITLPSPAEADAACLAHLAGAIHQAARRYHADDGCHVLGMLPDVARNHADVTDVEIRVHPYIYPDRERDDEAEQERQRQMRAVIATIRPQSSGLYYISDLDAHSPYGIEFVNRAVPADDYWHELASAAFVTSSVGGVVRTVPVELADYVALPDPAAAPPLNVSKVLHADFVLAGATVFDGTRDTPRHEADVAIAGDRIVAIGNLENLGREHTIDATGLYLMPGFIDIHSHADDNILDVPDAASHIRQGITTVLGGNCSFSPLGIGAFYARVDEHGVPLNIGMLVGNRAVRARVLGRRKGSPSYDAVYREKELVDLAMEEGAYGMSSGLIYSISEEAFAWELAALAKQLKPYGGFYASHVRGETDEVLDAIREAIFIGELAEVPVQISHMKVINRRNWGDMQRYLDIMRAARARGLDVTGDQYPWRASGPAAHRKLHQLLVREVIRHDTPEVVLLKDMPGRFAPYSGRPLSELLDQLAITPAALIEELKLTPESDLHATYYCLGDDDVCLPMREDFVMVCTDSSLFAQADIDAGKARDEHPRKFRSYPEFLARYVRDRGVCSWERGVYKCTGLPATRMGLTDRGVIRVGAFADVVLLDPKALDPGSDYRDQMPPPRGIRWVFLNGEPALRNGELTKVRAGRALRADQRSKP